MLKQWVLGLSLLLSANIALAIDCSTFNEQVENRLCLLFRVGD